MFSESFSRLFRRAYWVAYDRRWPKKIRLFLLVRGIRGQPTGNY